MKIRSTFAPTKLRQVCTKLTLNRKTVNAAEQKLLKEFERLA